MPDPRAQPFVTHTREPILTQEIYQILAGYPDGNDAQALRHDPLFQTLVDVTRGSSQKALQMPDPWPRSLKSPMLRT